MENTEQEKTFIQKVYPTVNNEDLLEFRIPANIKANMQLSDVMLRFLVTIPQINETQLLPENLFGAKQFSSVEIRINGDGVTRRSCANEYFLGAYFQFMTNFSSDYVTTSCSTFGIFDTVMENTEAYTSGSAVYKNTMLGRKGVNGDYVYEIVMPIESSIFSTNQSLPTNTPIDISFERLPAKYSTVVEKTGHASKLPEYLTLDDAYLIIPFANDLTMQQQEKTAISRPIKMKYDDYVINRFNIPKDSPNARLANIISGPLPSKIFWGIMDLAAYSGSFELSTPHFRQFELRKTTMYVDGNVLSGFPITTAENAISVPYTRFLTNTNRYMNCYSARTISQFDYKNFHFIQSAGLESYECGSLTFDFDFSSAPSDDLVLITCCIYERTAEIDNFRNIKIS